MPDMIPVNEGAVVRGDTPAVRDPPASTMDLIAAVLRDQSITTGKVEIIERLTALMEREREQQRKELFQESLRLCQMEMPRVEKNGLVALSSGKPIYNYAKLEDLDACIRPIYERHGFSVTFDAPMAQDGGKIRNVAHFSCAGHTEVAEITAAASNRSAGNLTLTDAQKVKQTITECRRHLLEMFFNVITVGADAPKDDPITQSQADDIRTRMNDLSQSKPGNLLRKLCEKYGVERPEEIKDGDLAAATLDVEATERKLAK